MTLAVGWVEDGAVLLAADTLVDFGPASQEVGVAAWFGLPKMVQVSSSIVVAAAGDRLHLALDELAGLCSRGFGEPTAVVHHLATWAGANPRAEFLVATTEECGRLWRIRSGSDVERGSSLWIGDHGGFEVFQAEAGSLANGPRELRMRVGMAAAVDSSRAPSVGGLVTFASGRIREPMRFGGSRSTTAVEGAEVDLDTGVIVPSTSDHDRSFTMVVVPTLPSGPASLAVYVPEIESGYFFWGGDPVDPADPGGNWHGFADSTMVQFVDRVNNRFDVALASTLDQVVPGETVEAFLVFPDGRRVRLPQGLDAPGSENSRDHVHLEGATQRLQMHPVSASHERVTWRDASGVLSVTAERGGQIRCSIGIDKNVREVAPFAALVLDIAKGPDARVNGMDAEFLEELVAGLSGHWLCFSGVLELSAIDRMTGQSHRTEIDLCGHDLRLLQVVRQLLAGEAIVASAILNAERGLVVAEIGGLDPRFHGFQQDLEWPAMHLHPLVEGNDKGWACAQATCRGFPGVALST